MTLLDLARKLRPYIEKAAVSLSDEDALEAVNLFPNWNADSIEYQVNDRVNAYKHILLNLLGIQSQPQAYGQKYLSQMKMLFLNGSSPIAQMLICVVIKYYLMEQFMKVLLIITFGHLRHIQLAGQ